MSRELRRVPLNWEHPMDAEGNHIPLANSSFKLEMELWENDNKAWIDGTSLDVIDDPELKKKYPNYADYVSPPNKTEFMPDWEEGNPPDAYQVYCPTEEVPVSPVFPTQTELRQWLHDKGYGDPTIEDFIATGYLGTMVRGGRIYTDGE